ncbi:MAG: phosphoglycerate kinase [Tenericutes bacterium]|nr:phosphoglycerate kinase [Mycoplasmatota bacterium]
MKTIQDFDLNNKKVIIRVDFNVPHKGDQITDDNRIKMSLETIQYALSKGAKVILMSHLGRVKSEEDKIENNLEIVLPRLEQLLNQKVLFSSVTRGQELEEKVNQLKPGQALLVQNTRYEDLDGKKESSNDLELSKYWANLGDIFINDAFGTCHRSHASNVGIASLLPSGIGFLVEKELKALDMENAEKPLSIILGGSKVSDKISLIENLAQMADYILIGGGMAYTFLKASGIEIGSSLIDEDSIPFCQKMLQQYSDKIILPIDSVNAVEIKENTEYRECFINEIKPNEIGLDIGYNTVKLFRSYLEKSKTIIWNGPVGMFEVKPFDQGTKAICEVLKNIPAKKIVGGGDTASAVIQLGYQNIFDHISTGGGASLELLEGKKLPGVEVIYEKKYH